jgi:multidrug efflux pump
MIFTDLFIRRPVLATVVSLLILLVGLRALLVLPIRQYPKITSTVISVTTTYPGASATLMQGFITVPIEQAIASAEGIDYMTSSSAEGVSTVTANINLGYDPNAALTDVMAKVQQVKSVLPKDANDPVILKQTGGNGTALMYLSFSSPTLTSPQISDYISRVVQPLFATVPGVASADILGGQVFAMRLWLDPPRMAARGISADDVANALRANNVQSAPGQAKGLFTITNVTADTGLESAETFRAMVVKAKDGALVRLGDIGTVELGPQSVGTTALAHGQSAVFVGIQGTPDGNPLDISRGIRALMPALERDLPAGLKAELPYDSAKFIRSALDEVTFSLELGIGIVVVVVFLFLGSVRTVIVPIVTIPLSLIGTATLMLALGFSLNLLTLLAMVLAIGLVVDDAIVVVENVYRWIERGKSPFEAALIGAREIVGPVIAMTITLAAVYAPIGFLGGVTGALFREFAFTLAGSVLLSGFIALTLSPMMASLLLRPQIGEGWLTRRINRNLDIVGGIYQRLLHESLETRGLTLAFGFVILGVCGFLFINIKQELAPPEDQGALFSVAKAPQYANVDYTTRSSVDIEAIYREFPETENAFLLNGVSGQNTGVAGMILKPWNERHRTAAALMPLIQKALTERILTERVFVFSPPALPGAIGGLPVQMVVSAPAGYETLFRVMDDIKAKARASGMFIVVDSDLDFNAPVIRLDIDRAKANDLGVTMQAIGDTLALLVGENYVNRFNLTGRSYEVVPEVPRSDRLNAEALTRYYVTSASGQSVPLSVVMSIERGTEPNALPQYNQLNAATFAAVPMPGVTIGDAVAFLERTAAEVLPAGFQHDYLSDSRQYTREGGQLTITFVFALVVIYLVLAAQFESLRDPLVILVSVPMAISGALLPLYFGAATLNIYTQVGLVTLVGLITKHGILMVEFANERQIHDGFDRRGAIEAAARTRLRPILMTTAAMVTGLVPLVLATGAGAASRFSIGLVIVAGMSVGTLFTMFVLPAVYTLLARDHRAKAAVPGTEIAALGAEPG